MKVYVKDTFKSQITSSIVSGFPTCLRSWGSKTKVLKNIRKYAGTGLLILENVKYFQENVKTTYFSLFIFVVFIAFFLLLVSSISKGAEDILL